MPDPNHRIHTKLNMQFQIMTADEVRQRSVIEVTKSALSHSNRAHTCVDPHLGCFSSRHFCGTCSSPINECMGHFGHIELGAYLYHPYFINEVFKLLKYSCPLCCTHYKSKKRDCDNCGSIIGSWVRKLRKHDKFGIKDKFEYRYTERTTGSVKLTKPTTTTVYNILKKCGKQDLLLSVIPVAPLAIRPTTIMKNNTCTYDPLTHSYSLVVREAAILKTFIKYQQPAHIVKHQWRRTQDAVYKIYDTSRLQSGGQNNNNLQGLRQRLDGKQGRFRKNLLGKRVDYCTRTVITADPSLDLDQIGIPKSVAMRLTKPIVVTPFNVAVLRKAIRTGPHELGGALYVTSKNGKIEYDLAFVQSRETVCDLLDFGDVVDRMLRDDDWVAVNRQPSLHKFSLMAHRVKILDFSTFRLNLSVTGPYNAVSTRSHY